MALVGRYRRVVIMRRKSRGRVSEEVVRSVVGTKSRVAVQRRRHLVFAVDVLRGSKVRRVGRLGKRLPGCGRVAF